MVRFATGMGSGDGLGRSSLGCTSQVRPFTFAVSMALRGESASSSSPSRKRLWHVASMRHPPSPAGPHAVTVAA